MSIVIILLIALVALAAYAVLKRSNRKLHSHWSQLMPGLNYTAKEFYARLATELKSHNVEGIVTKEVSIIEGGIFSSNRLYLKVAWKDYEYVVCFAPFGNGCFVSWWLWHTPNGSELILSSIPSYGKLLNQAFSPMTYYRHDTASMFLTYSQGIVHKVLDELALEQNIKALPEYQRKPLQITNGLANAN